MYVLHVYHRYIVYIYIHIIVYHILYNYRNGETVWHLAMESHPITLHGTMECPWMFPKVPHGICKVPSNKMLMCTSKSFTNPFNSLNGDGGLSIWMVVIQYTQRRNNVTFSETTESYQKFCHVGTVSGTQTFSDEAMFPSDHKGIWPSCASL